MIENSKQTPFKIFFGAPSCVPATNFETAGACINSTDITQLLQNKDIWYLTEMMNYPGVIFEDNEVIAKLQAAKNSGKPIDGHAPGVTGDQLKKYAAAGISTDHESFTLEEAKEKMNLGMKCLIREGSAAKNFEALHEMISLYPKDVMFCSDDKHPDELALHHINHLVKRALEKGHEFFDVLRVACINPVVHYQLPVGLLRKGDAADFIVVNNLTDFSVLQTFINGELMAENGKSLLNNIPSAHPNNFLAKKISKERLQVIANAEEVNIRVIEAIEGQLITNEVITKAKVENGMIVSDVEQDILKLVVINRYDEASIPAVAFIKNFGLKKGAIASTVAHDCHNIIAVGVNDESLTEAINSIIESKGGIAVSENEHDSLVMPLPIAGLMTDEDGYLVAEKYAALDKKAKELGSALKAPFMTLSFMALLVIPYLKLSDKGLFDGGKFEFTDTQFL
jgi:adenine deaminase